MITQLWSDIADFETRERKHDPDNLPRENARMEAYEKLQDRLLDEQSQNPCFHCETIAEDKNSTILPAEFELPNGMKVCVKHYAEWLEIEEDEQR